MTAYENLCDMRRAGVRPGRPVNVAFTDPAADGMTLFMRDADRTRSDWNVLVNLDVIVWSDAGTPFDQLTATLWRIAQARPRGLQLCFLHRDAWHLIDCGAGYHVPAVADVPALHEFLWSPLNFGGTAYGQRLCTAIRKTHKAGAVL